MKRIVLAVLVVIVVLGAGLLIAPSFVDWNQYKGQAQTQVKAATDLDLTLAGDIKLSLLPFPRIIVEDVSVAAPEGSKNPKMASLKRLEISVDLLPLFSGNVSVDSIKLVEPVMALEAREDGKLNIFTPKIEAMSEGQKTTEGETVPAQQNASMPALSLNSFAVEDATFYYYDSKTKAETVLENITADLSADSIYGPYKGNGEMLYQGRIASFELKSEAYNPETKILPSNVTVKLQPGNIVGKFAGALNFSEGLGAQGQIQIALDDLAKTLQANNITVPEGAEGNLAAEGFLSADSKKLEVKNLTAALGDQKIIGSLEMIYDPMNIKAQIKTEKEVDLQEFLKDYPELKTASFDLQMSGDENKVAIEKGVLTLNKVPYKISGAYVPQRETKRGEIDVNIATDSFNYDHFFPEGKSKNITKSEVSSSETSSENALAFPMDVKFSVAAKQAQYKGQNLKDVKVMGALVQNRLTVSELSFKDFLKSSLMASADVQDIHKLSGITLNASLDSKNIRELASFFKVDISAFPADLGAANLKAKVAGDKQLIKATVNLAAMNGEVIALADMQDPMGAPQIKDLAVQVKHRSMAEALQILSGSTQKSSAYNKPLDFYTKVQQDEDGSYNLSSIKGDLAGMVVEGTAMVRAGKEEKPYIKADLKFGALYFDAGGAASTSKGSSKSSAGSSAKQGGRWSKEPIDTSALNSMNADITLTAKKIRYGAWVLDAPKGSMTLNEGALRIPDLEAGLFDGRLSLATEVEAAPQPRQPVHINASGKLENVDVSRLVQALAGTQLIKASGHVTTDINLETSGLSQAALIYDLNGKGNVSGNEIVLEGFDIERFAEALSDESKPGDSITGLWKGVSKGGSTAFKTLDGNYTITEGIVAINKLDLDGDQAMIQTTGKIDLPNWTLNTKHKMTAKTRDVPPFEVSFNGSLDNPGQTFGQGLLNDYLQRKVQRKIDKNVNKFLSDKLGIPGLTQEKTPKAVPAPDVAPSSGEQPAAAVQQEAAPAPETAPQAAPVEPAAEIAPESPHAPVEQVPPAEPAPAEEVPPAKEEEAKPEEVIEDVLKGLLQ